MKEYLKYVTVSVLLLLLDGLWILSNYNMYSSSVKAVQKTEFVPNLYYAAIAYLFVLFSSLYIAIPFTKLHLEKEDTIITLLSKSLIYGGTVGLAIYGIYHFTCLALYQNYALDVAVIDIIWGTVLNTVIVFVYILL
jgi:uncharacterized membrane protein